jgi:hypothetical protein
MPKDIELFQRFSMWELVKFGEKPLTTKWDFKVKVGSLTSLKV